MKRIIDEFKWRKKYNKLCVRYETLASEKIDKLEKDINYLQRIIDYKDEIDRLKEENMQYRRKYGRLKGGDKNDKNKDKRKA